MIANIRNQTANYWFIVFTALVSIHIWSFRLVDKKLWNYVDMVVMACMIMIVLFLHRNMRNRDLVFRYHVYFFLFIPVLGCFGAYIFHHQPLLPTIVIIRFNLYWLFYFVLHILNIPKKQVLNLMLFMGGFWIFVTVAQQFTYPHAFFYTRGESDENTVYRAGVYRFMPNKLQYGMFLLLYCFHQYLMRMKVKYLVFTLCGMLGLYYHGARQFLGSGVLCLGLAVLFAKGKAKLNAITMAFGGLGVLFFFKDALLGEYIKMTAGQVENSEDDLRVLSANFFLYEYWPHWLTRFTGNGPDLKGGAYGDEIDAIRKYLHYYRSDVGIIGSFNVWGIFYVINVLWVNLKGLKSKYYDPNNRYLRLFFFNTLMLLLINETFDSPATIPFYCFIFYLIDKTYQEKRVAEEAVA